MNGNARSAGRQQQQQHRVPSCSFAVLLMMSSRQQQTEQQKTSWFLHNTCFFSGDVLSVLLSAGALGSAAVSVAAGGE
jgi:hypothetical protein